VLVGAGTSNPTYGFSPIGAGGGGGSVPDLGSIGINPDYLKPFGGARRDRGTFQTSPVPGTSRQPTAETSYQDPSYLWRVEPG
jgi:hypothetical protein